MLKEMKELKEEIECQADCTLDEIEISYLEQIKSIEDLQNYDKSSESLSNLAYDAAITLGLTDAEADAVVGVEPQKIEAPVDTEALEKEYRSLVSDYNTKQGIVFDAESRITDEAIGEGFASRKTYDALAHCEGAADEALRKLNNFKADNAQFVTESNAKRAVENARRAEENEASVWRQ